MIDDFRRKNMSQLQQLALDNKTSVGYGEGAHTAGDAGVGRPGGQRAILGWCLNNRKAGAGPVGRPSTGKAGLRV